MSLVKYLVLFIAVALLANACYVYSGLYDKDIATCHAQELYAVDSLSKTSEVLYFGESSNFTSSDSDSSKQSISEMIGMISHQRIGTINKAASHAGVYKPLIERLKNSQVKTLIVTMNLRSFGINWIESDLETNLSRADVMYSNLPPIAKKFMVAFKAYDHQDDFKRKLAIKSHYKHDVLFDEPGKFRTVRDWDAYMFDRGHLDKNGQRDKETCELACQYIKNYAFVIADDNPRVKDFDAIVKFCAAHHIRIIFHLLPENCMKAEALAGADLTFFMTKNADYLQKRYGSQATFVNNLSLLPDSCYIDKAWPTEHYIYKGRQKVAMQVAKALATASTR